MDKLALSPAEIRGMAQAATDFVADYYASLPDRRVLAPGSSETLRTLLQEPLPASGCDFAALLDTISGVISEYSRHNAHPRFFGYVSSPGTPVTSIGHMIAAALNINVTCWRSAPPATELEHVVINWLKEMLGCPAGAGGLLVSGGSVANFAGLAAARTAKAPGNVVRDGMGAIGQRMCVYVSEEAHFSIAKAAGMLGLGESNVRAVRINDRLEMDIAHLERLVAQDLSDGHLPFCVAATAGTTTTGAVDPLRELPDFAQRHNLWLHVDATYGGFAALAASARPLFAGIGEADSIALDPHKWLFLPVGCGCVIYRDPATALAAFRHGAEITRTIGHERDEAFAFWDYGPELSRPFRALDLWLLIKFAGAARLGDAIEQNIACARYLEKLVRESDDFEMLAPVRLSIFCFRHKPKKFTGDLNAHNERLLIKLQRGGSSYVSNAMVNGNFALRGCVLNYRTTFRDMEVLLEDLRQCSPA